MFEATTISSSRDISERFNTEMGFETSANFGPVSLSKGSYDMANQL
jgi:hypothetical protein